MTRHRRGQLAVDHGANHKQLGSTWRCQFVPNVMGTFRNLKLSISRAMFFGLEKMWVWVKIAQATAEFVLKKNPWQTETSHFGVPDLNLVPSEPFKHVEFITENCF